MKSIRNKNDIKNLFFENHHTVILIINFATCCIIDANPAAISYYGWPLKQLKNMNLSDIEIPYSSKLENCTDRKSFLNEEQIFTRHRLKNGMIRDVEIYSSSIQISGIRYLLFIVHDITNRKRAEEKYEFLSFHDGMTGLFNRPYLEEEIHRLDSSRKLPISLIMGDLNNLKLVNDAFGHTSGDILIKKCADILKNSCRSEDIIARWGGDEFLILLPETEKSTADEIIIRIKNNASCCDICAVPVSIALGSAAKNIQNENIYGILEKAEVQMYRDKLKNRKKVNIELLNFIMKKISSGCSCTKKDLKKMQEIAVILARQITKNNLTQEYNRTIYKSLKNISTEKLLNTLKNAPSSDLDQKSLNLLLNFIINGKNK